MKIKVILTGASGMVGEGILIECLRHPEVEKVMVIGRRPCGIKEPKLVEIIHSDFLNIDPIAEQIKGFDACFFCAGVSSVGLDKEQYYKLTYTLTMHIAGKLAEQNPQMTFCYVSGAGTDSTEKGKVNWARVKGKTENDLMKLPLKVYAFRPAFMKPTKGQKNIHGYYKAIGSLYTLLKAIMPGYISTLSEVGKAMISTALTGYEKHVIEVKDIEVLAKR